MGLLRWMTEGRRIKEGVRGEAIVLAIHPPTSAASRYQMDGELIVEVPGRDPYRATPGLYVPRAKWPLPGEKVPVITDPGDPERVQVLWDELPERLPDAVQYELDQALAAGRIRPRAEEPHDGHLSELHRLFDNTSRSDGSGLYLIELVTPPKRVSRSP